MINEIINIKVVTIRLAQNRCLSKCEFLSPVTMSCIIYYYDVISFKLKTIHKSFLICLGMYMLNLFRLRFTEVKRRHLSASRRPFSPETLVVLPTGLYPLFHGLIFVIFRVHIVIIFEQEESLFPKGRERGPGERCEPQVASE